MRPPPRGSYGSRGRPVGFAVGGGGSGWGAGVRSAGGRRHWGVRRAHADRRAVQRAGDGDARLATLADRLSPAPRRDTLSPNPPTKSRGASPMRPTRAFTLIELLVV